MPDFVKDTREFLQIVHDECLNQLLHVKFNPEAKNQIMTVSLYCSLIEYSGTLLALSEHNRRTGFSSVFRSFLEGYVDLMNLLNSEDFYFRKEAAFHSEWLKVLAECKPDNAYLKAIAESEELAVAKKYHEDALKSLTDKGVRSVSVYQSFELVNMLEEYHSLYRFECAEAHNDFRALLKRNVKSEMGGSIVVEAYLVAPDTYYLSRLDTTVALLIAVSVAVHDKVGSKASAKFVARREELLNLRKRQD